MGKKVLVVTFILVLVLIFGKSCSKSKMETFYDSSYKQWHKVGSITADAAYITKNYKNTYGVYAQEHEIFAKGKIAIKGSIIINIYDQCILKTKTNTIQYSTSTKKGRENKSLGFNIIDWYNPKISKAYTLGGKTSRNGYVCTMVYKALSSNTSDKDEYCISEKYGIAVYSKEKRGKDFVILNIGNIRETQIDNNLFEIPKDIAL